MIAGKGSEHGHFVGDAGCDERFQADLSKAERLLHAEDRWGMSNIEQSADTAFVHTEERKSRQGNQT